MPKFRVDVEEHREFITTYIVEAADADEITTYDAQAGELIHETDMGITEAYINDITEEPEDA